MNNQLTAVLEAVRAAQGVLESQIHSAIAAEMLRGILCNAQICAAVRSLSCNKDDLSLAAGGDLRLRKAGEIRVRSPEV